MTIRTRRHRPLTAGIKVTGETDHADGTSTVYGSATLTGVVRVGTTSERLIATVLHAFDARGKYSIPSTLPVGSKLYQTRTTNTDLIGEPAPGKVVGARVDRTNTGEIVLFRPVDEDGRTIETNFFVHDSPHDAKKIIRGAHTPRVGQTVLVAGQRSGLREVRIAALNVTSTLGKRDHEEKTFAGLMALEWPEGENLLLEGDSGAPILYHVGNNQYKMVGVYFAADPEGWPVPRGDHDTALPELPVGYGRGYAFPASVVESLGVSFGKAPPRCVPGPPVNAIGGETVVLDGSNSVDDDGMPLRSQWVQTEPQDEDDRVGLMDANTAVASFEAPLSKTEQQLTFELTVTDVCDQTDTDTVTVTVEATPEVWPEEWTPSPITMGTGADRRRLMYKVSNFNNIRTEWQADPDTTTTTAPPTQAPTAMPPTTMPPAQAPATMPPTQAPTTMPPTQAPTGTDEVWPEVWTPTEAYSGYGLTRERAYLRVSNLGNTQYEWRLEPDTTGEDVHEQPDSISGIGDPIQEPTTAPPTQSPPTQAPPTTPPPDDVVGPPDDFATAPPPTTAPTTAPPTTAPPTTRPPTRPPTTRPPTTRPAHNQARPQPGRPQPGHPRRGRPQQGRPQPGRLRQGRPRRSRRPTGYCRATSLRRRRPPPRRRPRGRRPRRLRRGARGPRPATSAGTAWRPSTKRSAPAAGAGRRPGGSQDDARLHGRHPRVQRGQPGGAHHQGPRGILRRQIHARDRGRRRPLDGQHPRARP